MDAYSGYSGAHLLAKTFRHDAKERVRSGGAWTETFVSKAKYSNLILADADARMVQLAGARSQQVSHQLLHMNTGEAVVAKSGDRFVLSVGPEDRFFYVQTWEIVGPDRGVLYACMERMS